jgi:2-polyprenyl-6-methoxyphenol hydroxylase-like FAD-dependent oxidoreductase
MQQRYNIIESLHSCMEKEAITGKRDDSRDILIAGAGPTGLSAAIFLAHRGIKPRVIEKEEKRSPYSKAFGVNPRTLELHDETSVTERLLEDGWKLEGFTLWRNSTHIARIDFSKVNHKYPFMLVNSQADTEAILEDTALHQYGLTIERGTQLQHIELKNDEVEVTLQNDGQEHEIFNPTLVLGADGAYSTVRQSLQIDFPGSSYQEPWHLYDIELTTPLNRNEAHAFMLDDGAVFMVRLKDDVWRVLGNVPDLLTRLPRGSETGTVHWDSDFGISHRVAAQFQVQEKVFIAGDAAHIHSGLGARGMNLGIEDAYVFAELVSKGRESEFGDRRRPTVLKVMNTVAHMTEVPRGESALSKVARLRLMMPLMRAIFPMISQEASKWILGLDHPVNISEQIAL